MHGDPSNPGPPPGAGSDRADAEWRPLAELQPGDRGIVRQLAGPASTRRRLMELGLVPGTEITFVRRAPLGDPFEVRVRGTHLSIRRSEAREVSVEFL